MDNIKRGEMFYIKRMGDEVGCEQIAGRPAIVVSNDMNNANSSTIEVVYLTTQPKTDLPTHVTIRSTGRMSTALCEQVSSVSTDRISGYIGECNDVELKNIDIALSISLGLDGDIKTSKKYTETIKQQEEELEKLKEQLSKANTIASSENTDITSAKLLQMETERNIYKSLYEQFVNKLLTQ